MDFPKQQSCQTALIASTEKIYQAIYEGKHSVVAQLDLSKELTWSIMLFCYKHLNCIDVMEIL